MRNHVKDIYGDPPGKGTHVHPHKNTKKPKPTADKPVPYDHGMHTMGKPNAKVGHWD